MNGQVAFALFLLVLSIGYFYEALSLPRPFELGEPGPAFLPMILSAVMFVACGRILYQELRGTAEDEGRPGGISISGRSVVLVVVTAGFIYLFEALGYWPATLCYTFAVALLFEHERTSSFRHAVPISALLAVGITIAGWLFFVTLFKLFLPTGGA